MSHTIHIDSNTRAGTIGGTVLVVLLNLFANDIIRTIGFAALGATVSFFVSLGWKWLVGKWQNRKGKTQKNR